MTTKLNAKSAARLAYETNALMTKMVRTRQMRIDNKQSTPAYARAIESIRKTKALVKKLRSDLLRRSLLGSTKEQKLVETVIEFERFARDNYEKGWGFIVECHDRAELIAFFTEHKISSLRGMKKHFASRVAVQNDVAADHKFEAASGQ